MAIVYEKGEVSGYEYFATKQTPHMELGSTEHNNRHYNIYMYSELHIIMHYNVYTGRGILKIAISLLPKQWDCMILQL